MHNFHHIEYLPTGELFAEQRDYWHTPYRFNGKELDEETGLYYYGARYYTPELGIWLSVDPLSDKYPSMSAFMYCAGNPVVLVDPDGREVETADEESRRNIRNTLTKDEARFVRFNKNGQLDTKRLNKSKSTSVNMTALKSLANSDTKYKFSVAKKDLDGEKFRDVENDYYYGVTHIPNNTDKPSPDNDVHIITWSGLDEEGQVKNTAHEAYGHAYFFELSKSDKNINPNHDNVPILTGVEWNAEFNINVPVFTVKDMNAKLVKQIKTVENQAVNNYRNRR